MGITTRLLTSCKLRTINHIHIYIYIFINKSMTCALLQSGCVDFIS